MLKGFIPGQFALVAKVDVCDMDKSVDWYTSKLDFEVDPLFIGNPSWRQLNMPGLQHVAMGLSQSSKLCPTPATQPNPLPSGHAVTTFVVDDINAARQTLIRRGVDVGSIQDVGQGVSLAFFFDPDWNQLGLRQNTKQPASKVGWRPS